MPATLTLELNPLIEQLDLTLIENRLMRKLHWDANRTECAVGGYREFLQMMFDDPHGTHHPLPDVDEVWHAHILHTRKYREDSDTIFGRFVDHHPSAALCGGDMDCEECGD